jgi:hypothetical protein
MQLKIEKIYVFDVDEDFDFSLEENIQNFALEYFNKNNISVSNEFFENLELVCSECGISLQLDEEKNQGCCEQCEVLKNDEKI